MPDKRRKPERETPRKEKLCKRCGAPFRWNERRAQDWDIAKYCSPGCSGHTKDEPTAELEAAILSLLAERGAGKTICPSEAAKLVGGNVSRHDWESLMEPARDAARRLAKQGRIVVKQKDRIVDPRITQGPIRLQLP
ncbi:DUF3253 domain-containing protein [Edaphobacter flagellatus]|uniref:DUF3253 domain-containing protein n=1 Tax=Edaphobacter flagellatus TaxID=1933044 RepID=UPI0021B367E8|nr:DUF3253 domain-containing protein [Edaphobacter flagellatus]